MLNIETASAKVLLEALALLEPARNRSWQDLLERLPRTPDMVAILDEFDTHGVQAISSLAGGHGRIVVFVLTGSRRGHAGQEAVLELHRAGATVIECRHRDVAAALSVAEGASPAGSQFQPAVTVP